MEKYGYKLTIIAIISAGPVDHQHVPAQIYGHTEVECAIDDTCIIHIISDN